MLRAGLVFLCLVVVLVQQTYGCPPNTRSRVRMCLKEMSPPRGSVPIPGGGSGLYVNRTCAQKRYEVALNCASKVLSSCPARTRAIIGQIFSANNTKVAWNQLCARRKLYSYFASCYRSKRFGLYRCLFSAYRLIRHKVKRGMTKSQIYKIVCNATRHAIACQDKALFRCGPIARQVVREFSLKTLYPVCARTERRKRSRDTREEDLATDEDIEGKRSRDMREEDLATDEDIEGKRSRDTREGDLATDEDIEGIMSVAEIYQHAQPYLLA